ncbi:RNA polymerase recycling motor HelD [Periweissella fabalis]|uniref:AAA family ATPase n=1 Tax=Periweissella fabalis TaxID=1070421 RepID=A0A7X6S2A7_9LACO|nr:RNA polymerase recycling motor HelD [Periweissella fabalis]MCM0598274.1 AAA family ATPase [Periweissella fabalis]NKZ23780.1 AAA family ATPase [Periweissella fabalis]
MEANEQHYEQLRVDKVIAEVKLKQAAMTQQLVHAHQETRAVERNYSDNASVNTFEIDDASETNAEIQQQRQLVARVVETETILKRQLDTLEQLAHNPYFGKIEIQDEPSVPTEQLYIGTSSLQGPDDDFLIYDWRAPIAAIYYNGTLGHVKFSTPSGSQETELLNKRQFTIEDGHITNMFDTNETVGDEMLQYALGQQNDEYMQNIVATIQAEQNDIIRDTQHDLLVVQGVAGSGKTSAILQRIAFLLYHARAELSADQILLFSPNKLFSNYIAEVLPSLGERNMRQVTLTDFLSARLEGLKVQTLFERYEAQQIQLPTQAIRTTMGSLSFMQALARYVANLDEQTIEFADVYLVDEVIFSAYHTQLIYSRQPANASVGAKMLATKNQLIKELKRKAAHALEAAWVSDAINGMSTEEYEQLIGIGKRDEFSSAEAESEYAAAKFVERYYQGVYDALFNDYYLDVYTQFTNFLTEYGANTKEPELWELKAQQFQTALEYHQILLDDATPFMYLRDLLTNSGRNRQIQHLFVDEMQDYTMAQMVYFKHAFPQAQFTILGDNQQALFADVTAVNEFYTNLQTAFAAKHAKLVTLNKSYRSTQEITAFGKALLPADNHIEAFTRKGHLPRVIMTADEASSVQYLTLHLPKLLNEYGTVAILTKTMPAATRIAQILRRHLPVTTLTATDRAVPKGVIALPIYLAKGLEFDCAIAYDVSATTYATANDAAILYTVATRAMHDLLLITNGQPAPMLTTIEQALYEKIVPTTEL